MHTEELQDENEGHTCQLLERLFSSADDVWAEPVLCETKQAITKRKNSVKASVDLPIDHHSAKFEFTWSDAFLKGLNVTLMYVNEEGKARKITPQNRLFVLSHEKISTREQWHINLHRRKVWRISLIGSELLGQSAEVKIRIYGGTWDWNQSPQAKDEFYSAWNELFGFRINQETGRYIYTGKYTGLILTIIEEYLWDKADEDKEECFMEVLNKLQGCNCRRLRMWNREKARFSTYLGTIVKNTCLDFRRRLGVEQEEPVEEDEELKFLGEIVMEEDEIEAVAGKDRSPLGRLLDEEFIKKVERRLWEFLRRRVAE